MAVNAVMATVGTVCLLSHRQHVTQQSALSALCCVNGCPVVTAHDTVVTKFLRAVVLCLAVILSVLFVYKINVPPVTALANVGPHCDPCGRPLKVIVQSNKRSNILAY